MNETQKPIRPLMFRKFIRKHGSLCGDVTFGLK